MLRTSGTRRLAAFAACAGLAFFAAAAFAPAGAQPIRPWTPPSSDSLIAWAAEARARFHTNAGDSVVGENSQAYERVNRIARRMLRALGRDHMLQAHAIEPAIDSLGLDVEVAIDPAQPTFVLVMVHNPFRVTAGTVGWLYWYRRDDLRVQGVSFSGGHEPVMKVWYAATPSAPYEWALLDRIPGKEGYNFTLLRLDPQGYYWHADQFEGLGPDLRDAVEAGFMDVNHDGRPELLAWARAEPESLFELCKGCPGLLNERLYTLTPEGYELDDSRLLPNTSSTFLLFVRLLRQQNRVAAGRLLEDPAKVDRAIALGWGAGSGRGLWKVESVETERPWPSWLQVRFRAPKGEQHWVVHFTQKEGRWVIKDWLSEDHRGTTRPAPPEAADTIRVNRGGQPRESR